MHTLRRPVCAAVSARQRLLRGGRQQRLDIAVVDGLALALAELRNGAYRASAIALYSTYQRREPPSRFSGISTGQTSGICPESQ